MTKVNKFMIRLERFVAYASLIAASLGLVEKGVHYGAIAKRKYQKKRHPDSFGFRPINQPQVRNHGPRSK